MYGFQRFCVQLVVFLLKDRHLLGHDASRPVGRSRRRLHLCQFFICGVNRRFKGFFLLRKLCVRLPETFHCLFGVFTGILRIYHLIQIDIISACVLFKDLTPRSLRLLKGRLRLLKLPGNTRPLVQHFVVTRRILRKAFLLCGLLYIFPDCLRGHIQRIRCTVISKGQFRICLIQLANDIQHPLLFRRGQAGTPG